MPRYDDRYGGTRLYVGHLSSRTRSRDLEDLFRRYGRVRSVDMKHDFAFVEFSDPRDADDARYSLDGRDLSGSRIVVEFAKGGPRGRGSSREYVGRGPPPGSGRCFNCGIDGHWARDCKAGDWKNKCYRCGERGHIERSCQNSPKSLRRGRSYSRTPSPRRGRSRSRSHSRSRSPPRRRERSIEPEEMSRSPVYSRSPSPSKGRNHSPYPEGSRSPSPLSKGRNRNSLSPGGSRSPPPSKGRERSRTRSPLPSKGRRRSPSPTGSRRSHQEEHNGSNYGESPRRRSPVSQGQESPKTNGQSPSPQRDDDDDERASQGGSQSPQN